MQVAHASAINRPYLSMIVVLTMTVAAARGMSTVAPADAAATAALETALRLALIVSGALAVRAMWQRRSDAYKLTRAWAGLVLVFLLAQELVVGFVRSGLESRLWAIGLIALVVGTIVWRVRPHHLARER